MEIIFLKRYLCDKQVGAEGITRLPDVDVQAVNLQLQNIYRRLSKYEDQIKFIDLEPEFFFTAPDAPFGPWTYHPAEEVFDIVVFKIIEKFKLDNRYISKFMMPSYIERVQRRAKVAAEKDELARQNTALQAEREDLTAPYGQRSFAVLLFQDLAFIPLIALVPLLAGQTLDLPWLTVAKAVKS